MISSRHTLLAVLFVLPFASCKGARTAPPSNPSSAPAAPSAAGREASGGDHAHEDPSGPGERSDLDRPVEELFSTSCEHGIKTFECDECRYENGVVKAPRALFEGGLLKRATVSKRRVEEPIALTGEIRFDERRVTHLATQTEGLVSRVHVMLGDRVKRGQPLLELESVGLGEAQSAYLEAQATLELARRNHDRQAELRRENVNSEREYLQAKQELEAAQIRARTASDKLAQLGLPPAQLKRDADGGARSRLVLRSPADGVVLVLHAVPGEVARAGEPLATIGDLSALWLWADLYERDLASVVDHQAAGRLSAEATVKAFPGESFSGAVDFIAPTMDEATRTVKVRIALENPRGRLRAGMFANVRVFLPGTTEVLAVPAEAVLEDEGRAFVFVHHHGDYFVRRPIRRGRAWSGWVEVAQGLAGGETLVGDGCFLLKSDVLRSKMGAGCAD